MHNFFPFFHIPLRSEYTIQYTDTSVIPHSDIIWSLWWEYGIPPADVGMGMRMRELNLRYSDERVSSLRSPNIRYHINKLCRLSFLIAEIQWEIMERFLFIVLVNFQFYFPPTPPLRFPRLFELDILLSPVQAAKTVLNWIPRNESLWFLFSHFSLSPYLCQHPSAIR